VREKAVCRLVGLLVALMLLTAAPGTRAADDAPSPVLHRDGFFTEVGFLTGFGYGTVTEGDYLPVPLIVHLGADMRRWFPSLTGNRGVLTVFLEPQVNPVFGHDTSFEAGAGIGLKYRYPLTDALSVYGLVTTGFLFITGDTVDQADGFNFSHAVGVGVNLAIMPGAALDLGFRARHVSNAGLREPNSGIDTYFGTIGFMITY